MDMASKLPVFNRSLLKLVPLKSRKHLFFIDDVLPLKLSSQTHTTFSTIADRIRKAKRANASVILMMGAHVIRAGVQRYLIDLMEQGCLNCIAMNGAGVIHDFELALIGATTESVAHYIKAGQFGFWEETAQINDIVKEAWEKKLGLGEAVGKSIEEERLPHRDISILAAGYRLNIPITVHVSVGSDIVHQFPNCNGAAYGATSYTDFLRFAKVMESLEKGVVMNFGSAVMAPEVYLKALSMVRNTARQKQMSIRNFTTLVCDLVKLPANIHREASREDAAYYFRPWKTMLVRTTADGGESYYIRGRHHETVPRLWSEVMTMKRNS
jgi:hypothetical protein